MKAKIKTAKPVTPPRGRRKKRGVIGIIKSWPLPVRFLLVENLVLGTAFLMSVAFALGALFATRWSEPIGESQVYDQVSTQVSTTVSSAQEKLIDVLSPIFGTLVKENRHEEDIAEQERLARKDAIKIYLKSKKSPFADEDGALDAFAESKNMRMMLAISFVESTFGKHCYKFNCSGIGGSNLREYESYAEWIRDFDDILERRYKDLAPEEYMGVYVQPGSPNWLYGVNQVLRELDALGIR
jgi:hypothetical protein